MSFQNQYIHEAQEVTKPLKPKEVPISSLDQHINQLSPNKGNQIKVKGKWKKIAREKGQQAQEIDMKAQDNIIGHKRPRRLDYTDEEEGKPQKKVCETQPSSADGTSLLLVTAVCQRRQAKCNDFLMLEWLGN